MDALVRAALEKVKWSCEYVDDYSSASHRKDLIAKAINAVDALKSALKAL